MSNPLGLTPEQERRIGFKAPEGAKVSAQPIKQTRSGPEQVREYEYPYTLRNGEVVTHRARESTMVYQGPGKPGRAQSAAVKKADKNTRDESRELNRMTHGDAASHLHPVNRTDPGHVDNITAQDDRMNDGFQKQMDADIDAYCRANPEKRIAVCRIEVSSDRMDDEYGRPRPIARQTQIVDEDGNTPPELSKWTRKTAQANFINAPGDAVSDARDLRTEAERDVKRHAKAMNKKSADVLERKDAARWHGEASARHSAAATGEVDAYANERGAERQRRDAIIAREDVRPLLGKDGRPRLVGIEGGKDALLDQRRIEAERKLYWSRYNGTPDADRARLEKDWNAIRREQEGPSWKDKTDARRVGRSGEPEDPAVLKGDQIDWERDTKYGPMLKQEQRDLKKDLEGKTMLLYSGRNPETGISNRHYARQHMANDDPARPNRHIHFGGDRAPGEPKPSIDFTKLSEKRKERVLAAMEKRYVDNYDFRKPGNKYVMIDHTRLGRDMNEAKLYPPNLSAQERASLSPARQAEHDGRAKAADAHWKNASRRFSRSASGTGIAFDYGASGERVYARIEGPGASKRLTHFISNTPERVSAVTPRADVKNDGRSRGLDVKPNSTPPPASPPPPTRRGKRR